MNLIELLLLVIELLTGAETVSYGPISDPNG